MFLKRGQSTLEYSILIIVVLGAFLGISNYFKRGIQGRWKASVDDLGDQYDPRLANSSVRHVLVSNTETIVATFNVVGGVWTTRIDITNAIETKQGSIAVGSY